MQRDIPKTPLRFSVFASRPYWPWVIAAFCAVCVAGILDGATNLFLKHLVDAMTALETSATPDFAVVRYWAIAFAMSFGGAGVIWRTSGFSGMRWITRMRAYSYQSLFEHLTRHSANYFSNRFAGAITNKISNVSEGITGLVMTMLWQFLPLIMAVSVGIYTTSTASGVFSVILVTWIVVFILANIFLVSKKRKFAVAAAEKASSMRGAMVDSASNITAVQQGGHYDFEAEHVGGYIDRFRIAGFKNWFFSEWILLAGNLMQIAFIAVMLSTAVIFLERRLITVGDVAMLIGLMVQIIRQVIFISGELNKFMDNYGQSSEGLQELLIPHEIIDREKAASIAVQTGSIEFRDVSFSYEKKKVFEGFNLKIPAGQKVGLVGHSGAGKTSLTAMLLRQYDIQKGDILIDGQTISHVTQQSLRRSIAIVPQDTSLFHRTIRENIRYGRLDATDEEVEQAAKLAQAHEFILQVPSGYDTLVGERGIKLSGGQRQRISIARAILKNAPILVLDEATSALDSESEAAIQLALHELMKGKTVLAIAHRLSTLRIMDRLIVLDKGKVVEDGTHNELVAKKGIYARLWESQVSGFIQE